MAWQWCRRMVLAVLLVAAALPAQAAEYLSLGRDTVYLRQGPSFDHKVLWIYHRKGLPVEVVNTYGPWRRVEDHDGTLGWIHNSMLSDRRSVLFVSAVPSPIRAGAAPGATALAFAARGVVGKLKSCKPQFCRVEAGGVDGWTNKKNIWGVDAGEAFR